MGRAPLQSANLTGPTRQTTITLNLNMIQAARAAGLTQLIVREGKWIRLWSKVYWLSGVTKGTAVPLLADYIVQFWQMG